jgi:hypothetical protein
MTIEPKPEVEHPAYRAAALVKELHLETIKLIDGGQVFLKDGVNVNDEIKSRCEEQIIVCDDLMRRAKTMDPKLWEPAFKLLETTEEVVAEKMEQLAPAGEKPTVVDGQMLPEIGDYDQT